MSEGIKNIPASIHARLTNEARNLRLPFSEVLQNFGMERFLYRLSKSEFAKDFVLKGGLIFTVWDIKLRRPTRDVDFLSSLDARKEKIVQVLKAATAIPVIEDGLIFDNKTINVEEKRIDANQIGISADLLGYLGRAEIPIHIDIGFSDEISDSGEEKKFPTILKGMNGPILKGYPPEFVVSEKFHAMNRFAEIPSRWKDYYDVWLISEHFEFDIQTLQQAIVTTFKNRHTEIPIGRPECLTFEFASIHQVGWRSFLKKNGFETLGFQNLSLFVERIWTFLELPLVIKRGQPITRIWKPGERKWK